MNICVVDMKVFARFDEIHSMTLLDINPWSAKPDICRARGVGSLYCFPRSPKNDFNNTEQV